MSDHILSLDSPTLTLATAGDKGHSLGRLIRAGFPVPPGFVVGTAAYHLFLRSNDLTENVPALAEGAEGDINGMAAAAASIATLFATATMPRTMAEEPMIVAKASR